MENEKLENQKINENDLRKTVGGYATQQLNYDDKLYFNALILTRSQLNMIKKSDCLRPDGTIDKENLGEVLDKLNNMDISSDPHPIYGYYVYIE